MTTSLHRNNDIIRSAGKNDMGAYKIKSIVFAALALMFSQAATAAENPTFEWRRFSIFVGTTTGGAYDTYARMLSRYIGKYLPGKPAAVLINRPGAGGLAMMNNLYASGARDGTEVGVAAPGFVIDRVLYGNQSKALFEASKFNWIGSMSQDPSVFIAWTSKGFTLKDVLAGKEMTVGTPGPGGGPWFYSRILNNLFGANLKVISGYPGIAEVLLSIENGELDGVAGTSFYSTSSLRSRWFTSGSATILVQYGKQRVKELPNVPSIFELTQDPAKLAILDVISQLDVIKFPVFAPPGVAPERIETIRKAFDDAMKDPELRAEAERQNLPLLSLSGTEAQDIVAKISNPPPDVAARLQDIYRE
jgi:tripartite-type tricarboxylate transporter receptor subunit TctC